jgi:hypothetical protein
MTYTILAKLIIADRRRGHRRAHLGGGPGDGIGAEVDHFTGPR